MSYILDALKKAERERGRTQVPTLETDHSLPARTRIGIWVASGVFVLCAAALTWLLFPNRPDNRNPTRVVEQHKPPVTGRVRSEPARPSPNWQEVQPAPSAPEVPGMQPDPGAVVPYVVPRVQPQAKGRPVPFGRDPSAAGMGERGAAVALDALIQAFTANSASARPPETQGANPAPKPVSLQDAVDAMTMSIHLYSEQKSERMVFINGRKYVEGEYVEKNYLLESITPQGAVLRHGDERAVLKPGAH